MGNLCVRPDRRPPSPRADVAAGESPPAQGPKLNPKDFMATNLKDVTVVRGPGQIGGQQFLIDTVDNCNIFLFDNSAQVTIDFATNCRIFIGPCESSVFFRDCKSCRIVVACQQLRTRDCYDLDMMVFSTTQPSIETTTRLRLSCFQASYFSLTKQFHSANLCLWDNSWWRVHDFNETDGERHWEVADYDADHGEFLGVNPSSVCPDIRFEETQLPSPVPFTLGLVRDLQRTWFMLVVDNADHVAMAVVQELTRTSAFRLVETRQATLTRTQIELLFTHSGGQGVAPSIRQKLETQPSIGLLFAGDDRPSVQREGVLSAPDPSASQHMANFFFQQFRPTV